MLKESYIKAIGIGLGLALQRAEFRLSEIPLNAPSPLQPTSEDDDNLIHKQQAALPLSVVLFLDGVEAEHWRFSVFDVSQWNTVAAVQWSRRRCGRSGSVSDDGATAANDDTSFGAAAIRTQSVLAKLMDATDVLALYE